MLSQNANSVIGYTSDEPEMPRSFTAISAAVTRARMSRQQVERMLDRICPTPREITKSDPVSSETYLSSLGDLETELNGLGHALDALDRHI